MNGKGINFAVKASKISANSQVWDMGNAEEFRVFEKAIQDGAKACSAEYTIARAGTLKVSRSLNCAKSIVCSSLVMNKD